MGILERIQEENAALGIVPLAYVQHSKRLTCEECGVTIQPMREGWQGRYDEQGQAVYRHTECPPDEWQPVSEAEEGNGVRTAGL